jgi:hypothetical protein
MGLARIIVVSLGSGGPNNGYICGSILFLQDSIRKVILL